MAKLSRDRAAVTLHPRENLLVSGNLGAVNAEVIVDTHGCNTVSLDLRGTFNLTVEVSGTIDGTNWQAIPVRPINQASVVYLLSVAGTAAGSWIGECAGYDRVRVRVTAYTSGTAIATLLASTALLPVAMQNIVTNSITTTVGTAGAATTLTIASPGAGLRHYLTYLSVNRFATALLTAGAAPVTVTTTNLPGTLAFSFAADAAPAGSIDRWREDFAYAIAASAQATATTVVCPATPNVIWRVTAGFYVAP